MTLARTFNAASASTYAEVVDRILRQRYGTTIAELFAENIVVAAERAGFTPDECAAWLAEVDGL